MINFRQLPIRLTTFQSLSIGFILIILAGSILLTLPIASANGASQPFIDALFTATSAVTTTGLVVVDTGSFYSLFGQIVILLLFQVGGLGHMIIIALVVLGLGGKLSLSSRMLLHQSLSRTTSVDMIRFAKIVIIFTFLIEFIGASLLSLYWIHYFPLPQAVYSAVFYSVSAFCTAGFGLFADSLSSYQSSVVLNLIIIAICIAGGIGFFVLYDMVTLFDKILRHEHPRQLLVHGKFVLMLSGMLMAIGTVVILVSERVPHSSLLGERLLSSAFQSVSASTTTGFNTVDIGAMTSTSLFTIIVLMFIGASPGGTGGGIKTASFGIMLLFLLSLLRGREDVNIFKRRISPEVINRVFAIGLISILWVVFATAILTTTEKAPFLGIFFEAVSAFGTVGLSTGMTPTLSTVGKIIISMSMLIGRVGPLAIGFSLIGRPKPVSFKYAQTEVLVG